MAGAKSAVMSPMAKALIGMAESHLEKAPVNSFAFALKGPGDEPWGQPAIARAVPPQYPYVLEAIVRVARLRDPKGNFDTETAALVDDYELGDAKKKQQALHIIERWQLSSVASTMLRKFPKDAAVLRSLALLHGETPEDESALALSAERRWREAKCEDAEPKQSDMSWGDTTCDVIQAAPLQHPTATLIHAFASKPMRSRSSVVTLLALQAAGLEVDIKPVLKEFHAYWRRTHAHYGLRLIFRKDPAKGRELGLGAVSSKPIAGPMSTGPYVGSKPEQTWLDPPFGQSGPFIKYIAPVFDEFVTDRETYVKLFGAVLADSWSDREMFQWIRYVGPKLGATPAKRVGAPEYAAVVLAGIKTEKLSLEQRCGWLLVASYFDVGPDVDKYRTYLASGSNGRLGWFAQDPIKRTCESSPSGQSQTRD